MLEQRDVAQYLLDRGFVDPAAIVDGDLAVKDASSRHRNFRVESSLGSSYFVKQAAAAESAASIAHEARVYAHFAGAGGTFARAVPQFFGYDDENGVLVLELMNDAQDLRSLHVHTGQFSDGPARQLGSILGTLHSAAQPEGIRYAAPAPWILSVHRPDAYVFRDASAASLELIRIVQEEPGFSDELDRVRDGWRAGRVIHGDIKWDNCLVRDGGDRDTATCLIDWESATIGDPSWDIGSALSQYVSFWLFSIPVIDTRPPERFWELARYPVDAMKPAMAACWSAYSDARYFGAATARKELPRAVECAGARLVQSAFEAAQMMQRITSGVVLHLQVALNILQRPREAATQLLGLRSQPS